jgi:hypothetical protein
MGRSYGPAGRLNTKNTGLRPGQEQGWYFGSFVIIVSVIIHAFARPFEDFLIDVCEFFSLVSVLFVYQSGIVFKILNDPEVRTVLFLHFLHLLHYFCIFARRVSTCSPAMQTLVPLGLFRTPTPARMASGLRPSWSGSALRWSS